MKVFVLFLLTLFLSFVLQAIGRRWPSLFTHFGCPYHPPRAMLTRVDHRTNGLFLKRNWAWSSLFKDPISRDAFQ